MNSRIYQKILLCCALLFLFSLRIVAQFESYSLEQGLSQSNVRCILKDKNGFLWIGTQDGLDRFDGYEFKVFKNNPNDVNSLSSNIITCLLEDKKGNLWVGTNYGLNKFNQQAGKFTQYMAMKGNFSALQGESILSLAEDSSGIIWIGTYLGGLSKFSPDENKFITFLHKPDDENSISSNNIFSLFIDRNKNLWTGTFGGGLNFFDDIAEKFLHYRNIPSDKNSLSNDFVNAIQEDENGNLYIGTASGICVLNLQSKKIKRLTVNPIYDGIIQKSDIQTLVRDGENNLWIGTETNGMIFFDSKSRKIKKYQNEKSNSSSLKENNVTSLLVNSDENIWVGTHSTGLYKLNLNKKKFENLLLEGSNKTTLTDANIWPIFEDSKGKIWVGTNNGLNVLDKNNHILKKYFYSPFDRNTVSNNRIWSINEDRKGIIWVGTQNGLNGIDFSKNKITRFQYSSNKKSIPFNLIKYVYPDKDGLLWLGTWGAGMIRFDPSTMNSKIYQHQLNDKYSISDDVIFYITEDSKGNFWICTSNGLNKFDKISERFTSFVHDDSEPDGLHANAIYYIFEDINDRYWIASHGSGLIQFNYSTGKFKNFTENDGLPNNVVYGILKDQKNNLWLSTNRGICKFFPQQKIFKNYNTKDGLPSDEFNAGAFFKSKTGKFYFGTIDGLTSFYPDSIFENKSIPKIAITDFRIFDKTIKNFNSLVDGDKINLDYSDNYFSFEFAALDFTEPTNNQYAYMLQGFDKDWIYSGNRRYAAYTHLDAGRYVFVVQASNNDGVWNKKGISVIINISPPYWATWWFKVIILSVVILLITYVYKRNTNQFKREVAVQQKFSKQLIEAQENERKRIASELHDGLGQNLLIISNLAQVGLQKGDINISKKQFANITENAKESIEEVRKIAHNLHPYQLDELGLSSALQSMLKKLAETTSLNLSTYIEHIDALIKSDQHIHLFRIVQEGTNNIIKHASAENVVISISKLENAIQIIIKDDGKGMDENYEDKEIKLSGFGLQKMRERVKVLNGNLSIDSSLLNGTTIKITIPVKEK